MRLGSGSSKGQPGYDGSPSYYVEGTCCMSLFTTLGSNVIIIIATHSISGTPVHFQSSCKSKYVEHINEKESTPENSTQVLCTIHKCGYAQVSIGICLVCSWLI